MSVSEAEAVRHLELRWEREHALDLKAAEEARALLPEISRRLRERGASKVVLFGSLVEGGFRRDSDIDIAIEGMDDRARAELRFELTLRAGREVDLVPYELAPPSLQRRIRELGEPLP